MANTIGPPPTGQGWDTAAPDINDGYGRVCLELRDLRIGTATRLNKEHVTIADSGAGGEHLNGSAVAYEGSDAITQRPDEATDLADNAIDRGRLWLDDNYDPSVLKRWDGSAWEVVGRMLVDDESLVVTMLNHKQEDIDGGRETTLVFKG